MRVWTRVMGSDGKRTWQPVDNDQGNIAWLQNALLLQLGESPFWTDWGLPVSKTLVSQIWPDYYLNMTQQRFRDVFPTLQVTRQRVDGQSDPVYSIRAILSDGTAYSNLRKSFGQNYSQTGPWPS